MALEITDQNLPELLGGSDLVVVDFWAPWCGPCRVLGPVIEELAKNNPDVKVGKLNVDMNSVSTSKYGISGIPAILFFKGGEVVEKLKGVQTKNLLQQMVDKLKN
jgi:thioredoxin 1